jgi:methylase of polypeptide subunit release factors
LQQNLGETEVANELKPGNASLYGANGVLSRFIKPALLSGTGFADTFRSFPSSHRTSMHSQPQFHHADNALLEIAQSLRSSGYQFITTTPATHARVNGRPQNHWARNIEEVLGWSRLFKPDVIAPQIWELLCAANVVVAHEDGYRCTVRLSSLESHLFWHSAYPTVESDAVFFGPDTYRYARAIQGHLDEHKGPIYRAADIGCGAGPGAILLAAAHPQSSVLGIDINDSALRLTRINAALAGANNVEVRNSNLLSDVTGEFDLLVANPPYLVDPNERAYRHGGGPLGAGLSLDIVKAALDRLVPGGTLLLYTGVAIVHGTDPLRRAVEALVQKIDTSWSYSEVDPDVFGEELSGGAYADTDRIAAVVLTLTKP